MKRTAEEIKKDIAKKEQELEQQRQKVENIADSISVLQLELLDIELPGRVDTTIKKIMGTTNG